MTPRRSTRIADRTQVQDGRAETLLRLVQVVAVAASEARTLATGLASALHEIGTRTGWPLGHAYLAQPTGELVPTDLWHQQEPGSFPVFRAITARTSFQRGQGIMGGLLESAAPLWIDDVRNEPRFLRGGTPGIETRAALFIPVLASGGVAAVLEFYRAEPAPPEADLLDVAASIGAQLGRVAERTAAERQIQASEARLAGIVSIAADAIVSVDEAQRITLFNEGAEAVFGYRAEEILGKPLELLIPERFRPGHGALVREFGRGDVQARRMGERREIRGLRSNGEEFPAEASISRLDIGGERIYTVVLRDTTERQRLEAAQRFLADVSGTLTSSLDAEAILGSVAESSAERIRDWCVLYAVDDDGTVRRVAFAHADDELAPTGERLLGEQLEGAWEHPLLNAIRTGRPELIARLNSEELAAMAGLGDVAAWNRLGASSLLVVPLIARERTFGVLALGAGADRRPYDSADFDLAVELGRRTALALQNARLYARARAAVAARDEVLSVVSHDLGNPLAAVIMAAEMALRTRVEIDERVRSHLESVRVSAEQMERLIQDLLEIRRMEVGRLELRATPVEPQHAVAQAVQLLAALAAVKDIRLEVVTPAEPLPHILADRKRLLQILSNLIGNAVKFTPRGGSVTVTVERGDDAGEVLFAVSDTGPGIPEEQHGHVFERFWQGSGRSRAQGIGLGLSIAKGLTEAHGGRIGVHSQEGAGSRFWFTMPATEVVPRDPH
jgi:PAS domain S-box-containing protein